MNDVLTRVFDETIQREGRTISTVTSGESFECFFRRNNDNTNSKDTMIMYYRCGSPVNAGTLLSYAGNTYIALNKETAENDVYFKSAIIKTNGTINTHSLTVNGLAFYGEGVNNAMSTDGTNISIISGNLEVLTEDNAASRALQVDDLFNEWGRTWKIDNLYFVDGICHVIVEVYADVTPTYEYELTLSSLSSYNVKPGDTDTLTYIAICNGDEVANPDVNFTSSNEEVATIDNNGSITYLADGEVFFSVVWIDKATAQTDTVTVVTEAVSDEVAIFVTPIEEIFEGFEETLTFYATKGGVKDESISVSFKVENISDVTTNYNTYLKKITYTDNGDGTVTLLVDGSVMLGKTFDFVAYNEELGIENRQTIKIISFF
ncbi:MAG: hypothetical protein IJZ33_04725 [Clostridia bacterium]|nr:hypothetical protein [Clostridia bacterium]